MPTPSSSTAVEKPLKETSLAEHESPGIGNPPPPSPSPEVPGAEVYGLATRAWLPQWIRWVGSSPWLDEPGIAKTDSATLVNRLHRRQAATLGLALHLENEAPLPNTAYLREVVRCSLIRWELSLLSDGRPGRREEQCHPIHVATATHVIRLLTDTQGFQTPALLKDIERHASWLLQLKPLSPWLEAALIGAVADAGVLVGNSELRHRARRRLIVLLATQDSEGWFPENGGADVGWLSLAVDALARLYVLHDWAELEEPLERALSFLTYFVHPDESVGGSYGSRGTSWLSPYGVELLATRFSSAATLARIARLQISPTNIDRYVGAQDDATIMLGCGTALAAGISMPLNPGDQTYPHQHHGWHHFPNAGLLFVSNPSYYAACNGPKGGAVRITWRNGSGDVNDPGITLIGPLRTVSSAGSRCDASWRLTENSLESRGILRRLAKPHRSRWARLGRALGRLFRNDAGFSAPTMNNAGADFPLRHGPLARDHFERVVTFESNQVHVRDRVRCRATRGTIVCQSPVRAGSSDIEAPVQLEPSNREPIFIEGGRDVEIVRTYRDGALLPMGTQRD